jgi:C_GCAxxG_C_C family probable redox protein
MTNEEKAEALFRSGHNCAQAVLGAFAEETGLDPACAAKIACGLGGGLARRRETCGAVSGAALVLGMRHGPDRAAVYGKVQDFCSRFEAVCGSTLCRDLLEGTGATALGAPEARTESYYRKRPCVELVKLAARLLANP